MTRPVVVGAVVGVAVGIVGVVAVGGGTETLPVCKIGRCVLAGVEAADGTATAVSAGGINAVGNP